MKRHLVIATGLFLTGASMAAATCTVERFCLPGDTCSVPDDVIEFEIIEASPTELLILAGEVDMTVAEVMTEGDARSFVLKDYANNGPALFTLFDDLTFALAVHELELGKTWTGLGTCDEVS